MKNGGEHLLSEIARVAIFLKINNKGRSSVILRAILSKDKDFFLIVNERDMQSRNQDKLERQFILLMKFLSKKLEENEFKFLSLYLKSYWPKVINENFSPNLSLKQIREFSKTFSWGITYPSLWLSEFRQRSMQSSVQGYVARIFEKKFFKNLWREHLWLFALYPPSRF